MYTHICKSCKKEFKNYKKDAVYCSNECRLKEVKKVLSSKQKDLAGQKFGKLTALYSKNINKRYSWLCKCDCGNEVWVTTANLINGHTQSCGCINKNFLRTNGNNMLKSYKEKNYVENTSISKLVAKMNKNNSSGVRGVYWDNISKMWVAKLTFQKEIHKKCFTKKEDAIKCRKEWEEKYFKPILEKYNTSIKKIPKNNTSGVIGVSWNEKNGKWISQIKVKGEVKYLGSYTDINEAIKVRKEADKKYSNLSTTIKCKSCGKIEVAKSKNKIYCSDCSKKRKKEVDLLSAKNSNEKLKGHYTKECLNCGKSFETTKKNQKYCSNKCYKQSVREKSALRYQKHGAHVKELYYKECSICGKEFKTTDNRRKYCSKGCQYEAHKKMCKKNREDKKRRKD